MAKQVFISHISEEAEVAKRLKTAIRRDFLDLPDVFVSSDGQSVEAGEDWLHSIERALKKSALLIILCSRDSIKRPWINFEAGAAWMRRIPLVPVCHSGLIPSDLPLPLLLRQGVALEHPEGLCSLYRRVAKVLGCGVPQIAFDELAFELAVGNAPVRGRKRQTLDEILSKVGNSALVDFVRTEVANGIDFTGRRLKYKIGRTTRFNFNITMEYANIWQPRRFREDRKFWSDRLGRKVAVEERDGGDCLTFKLTTAEHFKIFKRAVEEEIQPDWFAPTGQSTTMVGPEGLEFTVVVSTRLGRVGYRMLQGSSYRIRVEPSSEGTLSLAKLLTRDRGWKQPGDQNQDRFSIVVSTEELLPALSFAIRALNPQATDQWIARKLPRRGGCIQEIGIRGNRQRRRRRWLSQSP